MLLYMFTSNFFEKGTCQFLKGDLLTEKDCSKYNVDVDVTELKPVWVEDSDVLRFHGRYVLQNGAQAHEICGTKGLDNFGGIVVFDVNDESVVSGYFYDGKPTKVKRTKVYWDDVTEDDSRPYFKRDGVKHYFDEVLRVGL